MQTIYTDLETIYYMDQPADLLELGYLINKHTKHDRFERLGFDLETTSLTPDEGEVRTTNLGLNSSTAIVIDHFKTKSFSEVFTDLAFWQKEGFYVFAIGFEGAWIDDKCSFHHLASEEEYDGLYDVGHMKRSVLGGRPLTLARQVKQDLGIDISKDEQASNWGQETLTKEQIIYAGLDGIYTKCLGDYWAEEMQEHHWDGFFILNDCWRVVNEMQNEGMLIDEDYLRQLIDMWERRLNASQSCIRKYVSEVDVKNLNSPKQWSDYFKRLFDDASIRLWPKTNKADQLQTSRDVLRAMSFTAPYPVSRLLSALMVYNRARKYIGTYGETLITKQQLSATGRLHGRFNVGQAITGRSSSSGPNKQNIPHSPVVRQAFISEEGYCMGIADYSGVEIRVLGEMSQDQVLLHDAIYDDVHTRSAIAIFHITDEQTFISKVKAKDPWARSLRTRAKAFTFQLLYGAGVAALAIALRCTIDEAQEALEAWARRYPKAYRYRFKMYEQMMTTGFLPCASGRTIYVPKRDRAIPVAANYPIQGTAGDVMYCAIRRVRELLRLNKVNAWVMESVHDEVLLNIQDDEETKEDALFFLEKGMTDGWLDIFPDSNTDNLVDAAIGLTWADKA